MTGRILVLAGGASWEAPFLSGCSEAGLVVVGRCVDVVDLMAAATLGQAEVAVVAADVSRLDAATVQHLLRHDVQVLAVAEVGQEERVRRLGALWVGPESPEAIIAAAGASVAAPAAAEIPADPEQVAVPGPVGKVVAVWGATGSPGRSTVAIAIAAEVAATGRRTVLVDADPQGGSLAQQLGVLDESSGLLGAARKVNAGLLGAAGLAASCRRLGVGPDVLTGLPRGDRRIEVRAGVLTEIVRTAAELGAVVVDTGFSIEDERSDRDRMSREALAAADEIVVVGSADPVGLARLARGLIELAELQPATPLRVVVNRMRPSLGWAASDLVGMIEGFVRPRAVHLVPQDGAVLDRALVAGQTLVELGDSAVRRALAEVARGCFPEAQAPKSR